MTGAARQPLLLVRQYRSSSLRNDLLTDVHAIIHGSLEIYQDIDLVASSKVSYLAAELLRISRFRQYVSVTDSVGICESEGPKYERGNKLIT